MRSLNYYDLLMVQRDATNEDIEVAYKRLIRVYHPDANVGGRQDLASEMTKRLNEARDTLLDPQARREYDAWLASQSAEEEAEEPDLTPEQAAAADEAWQEEVRREDKTEPRPARTKIARYIRALRWFVPRRATPHERYFAVTRLVWGVIQRARFDPMHPGEPVRLGPITWAVLGFLLIFAFGFDFATAPLIFFYLWPLPWDGRLMFPFTFLTLLLIGSPGLPVVNFIHADGLFRPTDALYAFIEGHAWLARLNAYLTTVEIGFLSFHRRTLSRLLTVFVAPLINAQDQLGELVGGAGASAIAYTLTALAVLAIPYRLWREANRLAHGRLLAGIQRLLLAPWRAIAGFVNTLWMSLKPKGRAVVEAPKD